MPDPAKDDVSKDVLLAVTPRDDKGRPTLGGIALTKKLGQGGMGAVYQGDHPRLGVTVAVKVLPFHLASGNPQAVEYFMREAKVAARLNHPNLVRIFDVNFDKDPRTGADIYYLIMEFVAGSTAGGIMRDHVRAGKGPLPEMDALDIVIAATSGLVAAHDENIVHRDIKPDNIIVPINEKGEPQLRKAKLMDLGLAKNTDDSASIGLTAANVAMGTPGYMSPEQAENAKTAGPPADIFSMGAALYALLSGAAPFSGTTILNVLRKTAEEAHPPIRNVNANVTPGTAMIIDRCLEKNPDARFQSAQHLHDALVVARNALKGEVPTERTIAAIQSFAPLEVLAEKTVVATPAPTRPTLPTPGRAATTTTTAPPSAAPVATGSKSPVLVLLLLGCIGLPLLAGGGIGVWYVFIRDKGGPQPTTTPTPTPNPTSTATPIPTEDPTASFEKLMQDADAAESRNAWPEAVRLYEQALKVKPGEWVQRKLTAARDRAAKQAKYAAEITAGREALARKDWLGAERRFAEAVKIIDGPEANSGLEAARKGLGSAYADAVNRAKTALDRRDWTAAEAAFKEAIAAQADSEVARNGVAEIERRRDAERKALAKVEEARAQKDQDPERSWALACEAIALDPDLFAARRAAARAALAANQPEWYEQAIAHAAKAEALASNPEEKSKAADDRAELVREKEKSGRFLNQVKQIKTAIDEDDWDEALRVLEEAKKNHPHRPVFKDFDKQIAVGRDWLREMKAGDEAESKGDFGGALAAFERAEKILPRAKSKAAAERAKEGRRKAFREALDRARACAESRDTAGFAKAIAEARRLDPDSKEIADLERSFAAGPLRESNKSDGPADELVFSRDREHLFGVGGGSKSIMMWETAALKSTPRGGATEGNKRPFNPVALGNGQVAFLVGVPSPSEDSYGIAILEASKDKLRPLETEISGMKIPFYATAIGPAPDGMNLVRALRSSHGADGLDLVSLDVISPENGENVKSIDRFKGQAHAMIRCSPRRDQFATGGGPWRRWRMEKRDWIVEETFAGTTLYFWLMPEYGQRPVELGAEGGQITAFDFTPDGKRLIAGTVLGRISVVDASTYEILHRIDAGAAVSAVAASETGIAAVVVDGRVMFLDLAEGRKIEGVEVPGRASSVLMMPDAGVLFVGDPERKVRRYSVGRLK